MPGLVQGGLTIISVITGVDGASYAHYLRKLGLRALFSDNFSIDFSQSADYRELDVLLIHAKGSHNNMVTLLNDPDLRLAVVAIEAADRVSRLSPYYQHRYLEWLQTRQTSPRRSVTFVYMANTYSDEVIKDMQQIYGLPPSLELIVRKSFLPNLSIDAIKVARNHDKFATILQLLERTGSGLTVILTATGQVAETVATKLLSEGYSAKALAIPRDRNNPVYFEGIIDATEPILCIEKGMARYLPHSNIRHLIWHCLAHSPYQFRAHNGLAGRDGLQSRCTVLLSEQEIFNAKNISLAMSPSLHHIRLAIAELFRRHEGLTAGSESVVEMMRVRFVADLGGEEAGDLLDFLCKEGILEICHSWHLHIRPGPRLAQHASKFEAMANSMGFDIVQALEEATNRRLTDPAVAFASHIDGLVASGLLAAQRQKKPGMPLRIFKVLKLRRDTSLQELDGIAQKFAASLRVREAQRLEARREHLELFTSKSCILASLARLVRHVGPPPTLHACGHCLFCVTHKPVAITPLSQIEKPVDLNRLNSVIQAVPAHSANDPRVLTRLALGVMSNRVQELPLADINHVFGRMRLNGFKVCISVRSGLFCDISSCFWLIWS